MVVHFRFNLELVLQEGDTLKKLLKHIDTQAGIKSGVAITLLAAGIFIASFIILGAKSPSGGFAFLSSLIAVLTSGYLLKRKNKKLVNESHYPVLRDFYLYALGMTIVFIPALGFTSYYDNFLDSDDFGVLAKVFLSPILFVGIYFYTWSLLLFGSFFCWIKYPPIAEEDKFVTVNSFGNSFEAAVAKGLLETNEVPVRLQNQHSADLWQGSAIKVDLLVPFGFKKQAKRLLKDLERSETEKT